MSLERYTQELQSTSMFRDKLIAISEYNYTSLLGSLLKPPPLPVPDQNTHYIIMKIAGSQPTFAGVMTDVKQTYQPTSKDNGKLLFVAVDMKYQTLRVSGPSGGFHLKDGHSIQSDFEVVYRITDVESFWGISGDPPQVLQSHVLKAATNYFLSISSEHLIQSSYNVKQGVEEEIHGGGLDFAKTGLESNIKEIDLSGISFIDVNATVSLSPELKEYLNRQHSKLYGADGKLDKARTRDLDLTERKQVDQLIDQDTTFGQWGLREVIMALDVKLLNNFYRENWNDAMQKVLEAVETRKRSIQEQQKDAEFEKLRKQMKQAKELGLGEDYMEDIRSRLADKFMDQIDDDREDNDLPSNEKLFTKLIGSPTNVANQLASEKQKQIGPNNSND